MKRRILYVAALVAFAISGCNKEETTQVVIATKPPVVVINAPAGGYAVDNLKWFNVSPIVTSDGLPVYTWTNGTDTISTKKDLAYVFENAGTYELTFTATNTMGTVQQKISVTVAAKTYTADLSKVFEYSPAPGQFVNSFPTWAAGDNDSAMVAHAQNDLKNNGLISLGAYGGYVVMGFDHTVVNKRGQANFVVKGNAFNQWSEAGIVMVSADANGNGKPDDEWYELAGSEYNSPLTVHNYKITYYKPDPNKVATPDDAYQADTTYIRWKDNQGQQGYVFQNVFNTGAYWPQWKNVDSLVFTGTKLTGSHIYDQSGEGTYFISPAFSWGYSDNLTNDDPSAALQIEWAVDKKGNPVHLAGIDFVKVYTGMNGQAGWLGEISTEVAGMTDLNMK